MDQFYFNRAMGTTGAVSGKSYHIRAGQTVEAPAGEFAHLDPVAFKTAGKASSTAAEPQAAKKPGRPRKKTQ